VGDLGLVSVADQFLFGYDDGYRLLTGSRELDPQTLVTLLGATDAPISEGAGPLLTALALPGSGEYAFCVTWSAPEAPRPGAVWAHALVVDADALGDEHWFETLIGLPRRPAEGAADIERYRVELELEGEDEGEDEDEGAFAGAGDGEGPSAFAGAGEGSGAGESPDADAGAGESAGAVAPADPGGAQAHLGAGTPDAALLARLASAAYGGGGERIVAHGDSAEAARALVALWRAQWPALRAAFSFRVREVAREGASAFDLTVARRIRGRDGETDVEGASAADVPSPPWVLAVCEDAAGAAATPLRDFLATFGPFEPSKPERLGALARLWTAVAARDAQAARDALARDWPSPERGTMLKRALFHRDNAGWWSGEAGSPVARGGAR
jgi:hypothetical protein